MSPLDAAKLLDLPPNAPLELIESRFQELRAKLEEKIAKAPTPGLKAKYRENLEAITQAFEARVLAADASTLPVVRRDPSRAEPPPAGRDVATPAPVPDAVNAPRKPVRKGGGREFIVVAVVAVAVLAVGGWWVAKTRAENAEKARLAAEAAATAKTEAERLERIAREKAERERLAAEAEKVRQEKLLAETSARLADLRIAWDAVEQEVRKGERRLADLRGDERSLANAAKAGPTPELLRLRAEIAAQVAYNDWLETTVSRHEAKVLRAQAEAMVSVRQYEEAARIAQQASAAQASLDRSLAETRRQLLALTGTVSIAVTPAAAAWSLTDAYGNRHEGRGTAELPGIPWGPWRFTASLAGFQEKSLEGTLRRGENLTLAHTFKPATVRIDSSPAGAEIIIGQQRLGRTPAEIEWPGDGTVEVTLKLANHELATQTLQLTSGATTEAGPVILREIPKGLVRPDLNKGPLRYMLASEFTLNLESTDNTPVTDDYRSNTRYASETVIEVESPDGTYPSATRAVVTTRTHTSNGQAVNYPGTVYEFVRDASGWRRQLKAGGPVDPSVRAYLKHGPVPAMGFEKGYLSDAGWWPNKEVREGETWSVPPAVVAAAGIASSLNTNIRGTATGRLVSIQATAERQVAAVEFTFDIADTKVDNTVTMESRCTGRMSAIVDLRRNYVVSVTYTSKTVQNTSVDNLKTVNTTDTSSSTTITPL